MGAVGISQGFAHAAGPLIAGLLVWDCWFLMFFSGGLLIGFLGLCFYYVKGLWGAPRELYLLYFTKVTEYSAYGAAVAPVTVLAHYSVPDAVPTVLSHIVFASMAPQRARKMRTRV